MIAYRRHGVTTGELYFDAPVPDRPAVDILRCMQRSHPLPGFRCRAFHTWVLDVTLSPEELLASVNRRKRDVIRQAARDGFTTEYTLETSNSLFDEVCSLHARFAQIRNISAIDRTYINGYAASGRIVTCLIRDQRGNPLAWRVWYRDPRRARQIYIGSQLDPLNDADTRKVIARANTYFSWHNILYFKERGVGIVDLGGWHIGADEKLLNVNRFKASFGGRVVEEYHCSRALTWKGVIAMGLAEIRRRAIERYQRGQTRDPAVHAAVGDDRSSRSALAPSLSERS